VREIEENESRFDDYNDMKMSMGFLMIFLKGYFYFTWSQFKENDLIFLRLTTILLLGFVSNSM